MPADLRHSNKRCGCANVVPPHNQDSWGLGACLCLKVKGEERERVQLSLARIQSIAVFSVRFLFLAVSLHQSFNSLYVYKWNNYFELFSRLRFCRVTQIRSFVHYLPCKLHKACFTPHENRSYEQVAALKQHFKWSFDMEWFCALYSMVISEETMVKMHYEPIYQHNCKQCEVLWRIFFLYKIK